jgi:hypothetical protein
MATPTYNTTSRTPSTGKGFWDGYLFGAPMTDFGWFASLLMGVATGMAAFFAATFVGIFSILFYNAAGHKVDFAISYRLIGLPAGVLVMALALSYLGMLWVRRITRKA